MTTIVIGKAVFEMTDGEELVEEVVVVEGEI
jgi:hypothetical protein